MKKASNILLIVGAITSIVAAISVLITSIVFLSLTTDVARDGIREMYENGQITSSQHFATSEEAVNFFVGMFGGIGIFLLFYSIVIIANVVISFVAKAKSSKPVYIVSIVFGVIASNVFSLVCSILGLVAASIKQEE